LITYRQAFPGAVIGLSDHQNGIAMSPVAYALGARIIEKHFTLNRAWKGTDHAFSLEPVGLRKMVRDLRRTRLALGDGIKRRYPNEAAPLLKLAKKLVFARDLPPGRAVTREDLAIKSPSDGLPPYELDRVIGKVLRKPVQEDDSVRFEDLGDG
jgi:N-acetylneuraminate synthase/sialic acid synthase